MNKADLIDELSKNAGLKGTEAYAIVNMIFDGFTAALKKGGRIELRGCGSFTVREYPQSASSHRQSQPRPAA